MKRYRFIPASILVLILLFLPVHADAQPDYLRLHIIANSDSLIDQSVKLEVRDAVREYTSALLSGYTCADEAWTALTSSEAGLLAVAQTGAGRCGYDGPVSIELGVFPFPDREYGGELVPAGDYRAVRIILGEGAGKNWWCVVFPSMCLPEDADAGQPVVFYSSICRWALRLWEAISR